MPHGLNKHWERFRARLLEERRNHCAATEDALCAECARRGKQYHPQQLELHHKIPRRWRPDLKYDPENVEFLCKEHHGEQTAAEKGQVIPGRWVITGEPGSGKTYWVNERREDGDLVWDADEVAERNGWGPYPRPKPLAERLKHLRDHWLTAAATSSRRVFCIVTNVQEAKRVARYLGAQLILCEKHVCREIDK